jgi:hypothetical protein
MTEKRNKRTKGIYLTFLGRLAKHFFVAEWDSCLLPMNPRSANDTIVKNSSNLILQL